MQRNNEKYEELWSQIKGQIRTITKNSNDYDEKFMKIKFNWDDDLPLNETLELHDNSCQSCW